VTGLATLPADRPIPVLAKARLVGEIVATYVLVRVVLRRRGLRGALDRLRDAPVTCDRSPVTPARRLGRVVTRTLEPLPADTRCLMRSLVLTRVLARRGIDTRLVIGVHPGERFAAHAWVEHDGAALLPTGGSDFDELVTL
jgi:hypothetical protein